MIHLKYVGAPEQFLGNKLSQAKLENGIKCWSFSFSQHSQDDVKNREDYRKRSNIGPLPKAKPPWLSDYRLESDVTPELDSTKTSYYQSIIIVLRHIVELERCKLAMEVSSMASIMALLREGHLSVGFQLFSFMKSKHNGVTVFDPAESHIDLTQFLTEY